MRCFSSRHMASSLRSYFQYFSQFYNFFFAFFQRGLSGWRSASYLFVTVTANRWWFCQAFSKLFRSARGQIIAPSHAVIDFWDGSEFKRRKPPVLRIAWCQYKAAFKCHQVGSVLSQGPWSQELMPILHRRKLRVSNQSRAKSRKKKVFDQQYTYCSSYILVTRSSYNSAANSL